MNSSAVLDLALTAMLMGAKLAAPILITSLVVGFLISLFQSITQIQEVTLTFVPKTVAVGIALYISGYWMLQTLVTTTEDMMARIPALLNS
ncbi:flagellar biosynthetic protein FliQ [Mobiluncus massiliensis]|uniref:flagellar biosynthetic protein FliQ n=1 Tax=uncultured Mobiluncus sp. TaxID=293425 RepID=UPI0024AE4DD6|nr:flagellar biosynthetic protein FliQ [Mobiluncus sp. Marseille-Q7826]